MQDHPADRATVQIEFTNHNFVDFSLPDGSATQNGTFGPEESTGQSVDSAVAFSGYLHRQWTASEANLPLHHTEGLILIGLHIRSSGL